MAFDAQKREYVNVHDPLPLRTRRMTNRIGAGFEVRQKYVEKIPALKSKNIKLALDEWKARFNPAPGNARRPAVMVAPLSSALFLHELFRHSGMIAASCLTEGLGTVLINNTSEAVDFPVEGLVLKIMSNHFTGTLPLAMSENSPQQPVSGTPMVDMGSEPTGSPTYPLGVAAALSSDRTKLILSVVNPTEKNQQFAPHVTGIKLKGQGKKWQIAAPTVSSANEVGKEAAVKIVETKQNGLPERVQVPPISINVYEFEIDKV
jgi:alpha-L-arabinofuranosidase